LNLGTVASLEVPLCPSSQMLVYYLSLAMITSSCFPALMYPGYWKWRKVARHCQMQTECRLLPSGLHGVITRQRIELHPARYYEQSLLLRELRHLHSPGLFILYQWFSTWYMQNDLMAYVKLKKILFLDKLNNQAQV
jgi:hypothetical protein